MSIPLPAATQYECRNETLEVYASDRRGQVSYQFNNFGYRNNIDYIDTESDPVGVYLGSSITSAIGIEWSKSFAWTSAQRMGVKCYQFSQGCVAIDNQEILEMLKSVVASGLNCGYFVLQFINLDRRYSRTQAPTQYNNNQQQNIEQFLKTFAEIEQILKHKTWCFVGCDAQNHILPDHVTKHPNCVSWNFPFVDSAGVGQHPGEKWHKIISLAVTNYLSNKLTKA